MADHSLPVIRNKLTPAEWQFMQAYAHDPSDLQAAAKQAGLTPEAASKLLRGPRGRSCMAALLGSKDDRYAEIRDALVEMLWKLGTWDPADAFNEDGTLKHPRDLPDSIRLAITSFEWSPAKGVIEYKFDTRRHALALLQQWFLNAGPDGKTPGDEGRAEWIVRGRKVIDAGPDEG